MSQTLLHNVVGVLYLCLSIKLETVFLFLRLQLSPSQKRFDTLSLDLDRIRLLLKYDRHHSIREGSRRRPLSTEVVKRRAHGLCMSTGPRWRPRWKDLKPRGHENKNKKLSTKSSNVMCHPDSRSRGFPYPKWEYHNLFTGEVLCIALCVFPFIVLGLGLNCRPERQKRYP